MRQFKPRWVEKLVASKPEKRSFAQSLLTIGVAAGIIAGAKISEIWDKVAHPVDRLP